MKLRWEYINVDELHELRAQCKIMANKLHYRRPLHSGNFPMRKVNNQVIDGTVSYVNLCKWLPKAQQLTTPL